MLTSEEDGLSIICVILRHIETEGIDHGTLLYCYLKVNHCPRPLPSLPNPTSSTPSYPSL